MGASLKGLEGSGAAELVRFTATVSARLGARGVFFFISIEQKCQRGPDADPRHGGDPVERRRTSQRNAAGTRISPAASSAASRAMSEKAATRSN